MAFLNQSVLTDLANRPKTKTLTYPSREAAMRAAKQFHDDGRFIVQGSGRKLRITPRRNVNA